MLEGKAMAVSVVWSADITDVLECQFSGKCGLEDMRQVVILIDEASGQYDKPFDFIVNFSNTSFELANYLSLVQLAREKAPQMRRLQVAVAIHPILATIIPMIQTLAPKLMVDFHYPTLEEAHACVRQYRRQHRL
jgi:hypothetical protein